MADDVAGAVAERDPQETELTREALTMALYVSLSLLAVLIALPAVSHVDNRVACRRGWSTSARS